MLRMQFRILPANLDKPCTEGPCGYSLAVKQGIQSPEFDGHKRHDGAFPLNYQPQRDRLDPAGRKRVLAIVFSGFIKQWADLIPDQAVEDTPRLLCIDQVHVDLAWIGDSFTYCIGVI